MSARTAASTSGLADVGGGGRIEAQGLALRRHDDGGTGSGQGGKGRRRAGAAVEHISAAPHFARHQPALAGERIGASDGADGDPEIEGEIALGGSFAPAFSRPASISRAMASAMAT